MGKNSKAYSESDVAGFYNELVFPSRTSHTAYEELVPDGLEGKKVGDFGCGQSLFIDQFRRRGYDAIFLDIAPNALREIDYGEKILASLTSIPLPDQYMDHIFCIGVVHHIPDMEKALSEMLRVLKPGGTLTLGVYAPGSAQARLRALHDAIGFPMLQLPIRWLVRILVWIKNRKNGLSLFSRECAKRVDDLLLTPLVRYLPVNAYREIIETFSGQVVSVSRISSMNILEVRKSPPPT